MLPTRTLDAVLVVDVYPEVERTIASGFCRVLPQPCSRRGGSAS